MAADTLKSLSLTNFDATPPLANPTGKGAGGYDKNVSDFVTPTTGGLVSTSSVYKILRVPTNIKLKDLTLSSDLALDSSTGLALDVGAYYSDAPLSGILDGTPVALAGTLISANCFAAILAFQASHQKVYALSAYPVANRNLPLWLGLGLSADPGGFIDIAVAVHTVATTAVSSNLGADATYVE